MEALARAIGVGLIGAKASEAVGRNPAQRRKSWGSPFWHRVSGRNRVFAIFLGPKVARMERSF